MLIAGVILPFTGRYPERLYDFVLGMNRWVLRVAAYAGLMTDAYPPFRFDMGGHENGGTLVVPPPTAPAGSAAPVSAAPARPAGPGSGWTGPRVASLVIGSVLVLGGLAALGVGGTAAWYDQHRDSGYVVSTVNTQHADGYAVTTDRIELGVPGSGWQWTRDLIGTVRIRVTGNGEAGTFVGIAPTDQAARYLAGVPHTVLKDLPGRHVTTVDGTAVPQTAPAAAAIWVAESTGPGTRVLAWTPTAGDWTVVIMNADASRGLTVRGDVGATVPALTGIAVGLLVGGAVLVAGGTLLVVLAVRRASGEHS